MEPSNGPLVEELAESLPPSTAELVQQGGPRAGERHPLSYPLTVLGRAARCDIRLDADGVQPFHCSLVLGPAGLRLRELQAENDTLLNGRPVADAPLCDGDVLAVGPFQLRVRLPRDLASAAAQARPRDKEALRIQAAAIAAQQAALAEEEIRLQQRQGALEQQEQQLAAHLEEKRQRLTALRDEARRAQAALREERAAHERRVAEELRALGQARQEVADQERQLQTERGRLLKLRRRMKHRWHRHWAAERAAMRRRETELGRLRQELEEERERLRQERAGFGQTLRRANGEIELGRRHLRADRERLRQRFDELQERARTLEEQEQAVQDGQRRLADEQRHGQEARARLGAELEGLENRIQNCRRKLREHEQEAARLKALVRNGPNLLALPAPAGEPSQPAVPPAAEDSPPSLLAEVQRPTGPSPPREEPCQGRLAELEKLAGELADQRHCLVEACERFARARQHWQQEGAAATAALVNLGLRLQEREEAVQAREQALGQAEQQQRQRSEETAQGWRQLEAWKARLAAGAASEERERQQLLAGLRSQQELVEQRPMALAGLRQRWDERRRRQVQRLRARRAIWDELRRECATLRAEWLRRSSALAQQQRDLANRALALERYRQECLARSPNAAAADRRLKQLRRHEAALSARALRALARLHRSLQAEADRLDQRLRQFSQQAEELVTQEAELTRRQTAWEQQQVRQEGEQAGLLQEILALRGQRQQYERQLEDLREQVECLARLLLDGNDSGAAPQVQAA